MQEKLKLLKPKLVLILLTISIGFIIFVLVLVSVFNNNQTVQSSNTSEVSYSVSLPSSLTQVSKPNTLLTYTNPNLLDLSFKYDSSWDLSVKEFGQNNTIGFKSKYFPSCDNNCMGLRFSKEDVSLNIIFVLALDDSGKKCSNTVSYESIGNDWLRVRDSSGYFYTRNFQLDVSTMPEEMFNLGSALDEWSLLNNTNYKLCVKGNGFFREVSVNVNNSPAQPGTLVENPTIEGNPSQVLIEEMDQIVKSLIKEVKPVESFTTIDSSNINFKLIQSNVLTPINGVTREFNLSSSINSSPVMQLISNDNYSVFLRSNDFALKVSTVADPLPFGLIEYIPEITEVSNNLNEKVLRVSDFKNELIEFDLENLDSTIKHKYFYTDEFLTQGNCNVAEALFERSCGRTFISLQPDGKGLDGYFRIACITRDKEFVGYCDEFVRNLKIE